MRRLLVAPVVLVPVAAAGALVWLTGLAWPIAVTFSSVVLGRRPGPDDEPELVG